MSDLRNYHHGQRVVELGGDGTVFKIMGFDWTEQNGWRAKLAATVHAVAPFHLMPITNLKPADQSTIH